jgi:hypothetical protein
MPPVPWASAWFGNRFASKAASARDRAKTNGFIVARGEAVPLLGHDNSDAFPYPLGQTGRNSHVDLCP